MLTGIWVQTSIRENYEIILMDIAHLCLPTPISAGLEPYSGALTFGPSQIWWSTLEFQSNNPGYLLECLLRKTGDKRATSKTLSM